MQARWAHVTPDAGRRTLGHHIATPVRHLKCGPGAVWPHRRTPMYYREQMSTPPRSHKPYTVYRAGDVPGPEGAAPPDGPDGALTPAAQRPAARRAGRGAATAAAGPGAAAAASSWPAHHHRHRRGRGDRRGRGGGWGPFGADAARSRPAAPSPRRPRPRRPPPPPRSRPPRARRRARPRPSPRRFSMTAGGDVIGGFGVSGVVASMGSSLFKSVAPSFEKSDFGFVNLESPLTTGGDAQGWKDVVIKGNPDWPRRWPRAASTSSPWPTITPATWATAACWTASSTARRTTSPSSAPARTSSRPWRARCWRPTTASEWPSSASPTYCRWGIRPPPRAQVSRRAARTSAP